MAWLVYSVDMARSLTEQERAERAAANKAAWATNPANANVRVQQRRQGLEEARIKAHQAEPIGSDDDTGSASLTRLREIMADDGAHLYRRLEAAEIILGYELAPGAVAGADPDSVAAASYQFLKAVIAQPEVPDALEFRALKAIAQVENMRSQIRNDAEALFAKRAMLVGACNAERRACLVEQGLWPPPADTRWLSTTDAIALPNSWLQMQWPSPVISHAYSGHDLTAFRRMLRGIRAGVDDTFWDDYASMADGSSAQLDPESGTKPSDPADG